MFSDQQLNHKHEAGYSKFAWLPWKSAERPPLIPPFLALPNFLPFSPLLGGHMAPWSFCLLEGRGKNPKYPASVWKFFSFFLKNIIRHQETEQSACRYYTCIINKISLFIYRVTRGTGELGLSPLYMKRGRERMGEANTFWMLELSREVNLSVGNE